MPYLLIAILNNPSTEERTTSKSNTRAMKRFFALLLTAATFIVACTKAPQTDIIETDCPLSFYLDFNNTRIEFTENNTYRWQGDEVLGIYIGSVANTINVPAAVALDGEKAICRTLVNHYSAGDNIYVYYPWSELNDMKGISDLTLTIPTAQKQAVAGEFVVENMPMVSAAATLGTASTRPTVYMRPLAGILRLNIRASAGTTERVTSVSYTATEGVVAGEFSVDMSNVTVSNSIPTSKCDKQSVTLSVSEPYTITTTLADTKSLYMVLAPNQASGTLTVTTDKAIYSYNYATNIERNKYYDLNIDLSNAPSRQSIEGEWGGGDGSADRPYLIRTAADIALIATRVNNNTTHSLYADKHYRQVSDIDLKGTALTPIGVSSTLAFSGNYDGGGYTLANASITPNPATAPCGLFGYTIEANISNLTVCDFTINSTAYYQSALVGYAEQTNISGCTFEGKTNFYNLYSGGFAGYMYGGTISNCTVKGLIENGVKGNNITGEQNCAFTAGCVGHAVYATIERCTIEGDVATMGRYAAGVVAMLEDSTVSNCHTTNTCEVSNVSHYCGGIAAIMKGNDSLIENCRFDGRVNTSYPIAGAIVGSITAGKVYNCISTRNSTTTSYEGYSGGIAGQMYTATASDIAIIDNCAAYGQVEGAYNIGGIVGYMRNTKTGGYVGVTNCAALNSKLISRGSNTYGYNLIGGIAGWLHGNNKNAVIANCAARPAEIHGAPISVDNNSNIITTKDLIGGVIACANIDDIALSACYTDVVREKILIGFQPIAAVSSGTVRHGAIFGYAYNSLSVNGCYYHDTMDAHGSVGSGKSASLTNCSSLSSAQMTDGTLLAKLNTAAASYTPANGTPAANSWTTDSQGYPIPEGLPVDTTPANAEPKKVSVIGDSISTFRGYIPYGYSTYYPRTDGTFTSVADMYWHQLIYKHMTNARLERNIAYSGSWVTNASASANTYFAKRFINQNGVGDADIVIIHGGTNDWNKNAVNLVSGLSVRATSGPTDAQLDPLFTTADAATTRAQIEALDDTTFCSAYIKLVKLIQERNPNVKIVCVIGDYLGVGVQQATHKIAQHYGARCVDLRAVNGFNDQTYMPKLYYAPDNTGQCHPNQQAMAFIADKIYSELGAWLEE